MYRIVKKESLNPSVTRMSIEAPLVAKKVQPGQFIILRVEENGERIPLTVAGYDRDAGTVDIIFQIVGATTEKLNHKQQGETIPDFVGPLGKPTETEGLKRVAVSEPHPTISERWDADPRLAGVTVTMLDYLGGRLLAGGFTYDPGQTTLYALDSTGVNA